MHDQDMLTSLVAQTEAEGGDIVMIRAIIEEASTIGASHALDRLGLSDAGAAQDVRELRELLSGWRDTKKAAGSALLSWLMRLGVMLLLLGIAARTDLLPELRL